MPETCSVCYVVEVAESGTVVSPVARNATTNTSKTAPTAKH